MGIIIPKSVINEITRIGKGKKKKKKSPKKDFLPLANKNFDFLNDIAKIEPIHSFLKDNKILVLNEFSLRFGKNALVPRGNLWLETIQGKTGLYHWLDANYSANRSDNDHSLIKAEELPDWHEDSLERFASLNKKEIWKAIRDFLGAM